jgi:hypothetical protein
MPRDRTQEMVTRAIYSMAPPRLDGPNNAALNAARNEQVSTHTGAKEEGPLGGGDAPSTSSIF